MILQYSAYLTNPFFYTETIVKYISFVVLLIIMFKVRGKYLEKKQEVAQNLYLAIFCFACAPIVQSFDVLFLSDLNPTAFYNAAGVGQIVTFTFAAIANYFLLKFTIGIAGKGSQRITPWVLAINLMAIAFSAFFIIMNKHSVSTIFLIVHVIISYTVFGLLTTRTFATARHTHDVATARGTTELVDIRGLQLIAWFGIFLILMYAFIILDIVYEIVTNTNNFTVFGTIGWGLCLVGVYVAVRWFLPPSVVYPPLWGQFNSKGRRPCF